MSKSILIVASTASHFLHFHLPYLKKFNDLGYTVHIAYGGKIQAVPEADAVHCVCFEKSILSVKNLKAADQLKKLIRVSGFDAVICHTSLAAFFTRLAVLGMRSRPVIINTVHGYLFDHRTPLPKKVLYLTAEKLTAPVTDRIITMNREDREIATRHQLARDIRFCRGMGVDFSRFSDAKELDFRRSLDFSDDDFVMIYAAEFSKRKNQQMLIRAMSLLPDRVKLILTGDGAMLQSCKELSKSLGASRRILFPGRVENMPKWYAAADLVVSASRSEGLPFHLMEAMYCGLPAVVSEVKGHTDLIVSGKNGFLFPYNDFKSFASHIRSVLADTELYKKLSRNARQSVLQYDLKTVLPETMELYLSSIQTYRKKETN